MNGEDDSEVDDVDIDNVGEDEDGGGEVVMNDSLWGEVKGNESKGVVR